MKTKDFYSVVTRLCAQKGISITALGEELRFSKATTNGWKKGAQPQAKTLKAISDYFGVSIDFLMGEDDALPVVGRLIIWKETILFSVDENPVVLQELKNDDYASYCVQFAGRGKYCPQLDDVAQYLNERWEANLDTDRLLQILQAAPVVNIAPRMTDYKNQIGNIHNSNVVQGNNISNIKQGNGAEHPLSDQESELLRIFAELGTVEQAKVLIFAAELRENK